MLKNRRPSINNEKGMAAFEMIPILVVIVMLMNFALGFFGSIHTGILQSISARNYTFETFRHRADLTYFKTTLDEGSPSTVEYSQHGLRVHGTASEKRSGDLWVASSRTIDFYNFERRAAEVHAGHQESWSVKDREQYSYSQGKKGVNPIWIKTHYGICLNAACGS